MPASRAFCCVLAIVLFPQAAQIVAGEAAVQCEGRYRHHLQGFCKDDRHLFWSFTTTLVKTDLDGKVLKKIPVRNHHGDLCHHKGKLYVAVNFGRFNDAKGNADSWVVVYDAASLKELARHKTPQVVHGAGGIGVREGRFYVVGGLPPGFKENSVYEYDAKFQFQKKHVLNSGYTLMGIQTATFAEGHWWFGCYGSPKILLKTDAAFKKVERFKFDCSLGIGGGKKGTLLIARGKCVKGKGCDGRVMAAKPDGKRGLVTPE